MIRKQEFFVNRGLFIFAAGLNVFMIAMCLYLLYLGYRHEANPKEATQVGLFGACVFGLCLLLVLKSLQRKTPTLQIDDDGIVLPDSVGRIPWSNIRGARTEIRSNGKGITRYVVVDVVDKELVLAPLSFWKKIILRGNQMHFSTPVSISEMYLSAPVNEVQEAIQNALQVSRTSHQPGYQANAQGNAIALSARS